MLALRRNLGILATHCRYFRSTQSVLFPTIWNEFRNITVEPLKNRTLISVSGAEAKSFLQGLITNDINQLDQQINFAAMYTLFLNRGGRVLYDAIIYRAPKEITYYIECDRTICSELRRYLRQYRVRRKIDIDQADAYDLWVAFSSQKSFKINSLADGALVAADPRTESLGTRLFIPKNENWKDVSKRFSKACVGIAVEPEIPCSYQIHRYEHGIAEGVEELPPGKCFPLEANADYLHGISFHKGCYVGQELTARTYHTGVVRKRLLPMRFSWPVTKIGEQISTDSGSKIGVVRGCISTYGLGVLNVEKALNASGLLIDGEPCRVIKPNWWPTPVKEKKIIADA